MICQFMIGTNDIERSKRFYDAILALLGAPDAQENTGSKGQKRLFYRHKGTFFAITEPLDHQPATTANGLTIGFECSTPAQVKEFHTVGIAHGGTPIEDAPGPRETSLGPYHLAYMLDPDGHKICAMFPSPLP